MKLRPDQMLRQTKLGFTNATDAADYLVKHGVPFRDAHGIIGRMVAYAIENNKALDEFSMEEFQTFSSKIKEDIYDAIAIQTCVQERRIAGAPGDIDNALGNAKKFLCSISQKND